LITLKFLWLPGSLGSGNEIVLINVLPKLFSMKLRTIPLGIATVTSIVFAQIETTTTTITGTGTIVEYSPGSAFVIEEKSGPVSYRYGDKVTYVTRSGKTPGRR
jgi:hypothetical protein